MIADDKLKNKLWKEFKESDAFTLLIQLDPYDQQEVCFKAGIEAMADEFVVLRKEDWENIKKRL